MTKLNDIKDGNMSRTLKHKWMIIIIGVILMVIQVIGASSINAAGKDVPLKNDSRDQVNADKRGTRNHLKMSISNGVITAKVTNQPLNYVLKEIEKLSGVKVVLQGRGLKKNVSVQCKNLALDQALQNILQGESYFLLYSQEEQRLDQVVVLPSTGSGNEEVAYVNDRTKQKFNSDHEEEKPIDELSRVMEIAAEGKMDEAREELIDLFNEDSDPMDRSIALSMLLESGAIPPDKLVETAYNDKDLEVRREAMRYLTMNIDKDSEIEDAMNLIFYEKTLEGGELDSDYLIKF